MSTQSLPQPLGNFEFSHSISKGETMSGIAAKYQAQGWPVKGWRAIWRLNTLVYANLRDRANPDKIYPGDVLIMPRSEKGYAATVDRLAQLRKAVGSDNSASQTLQGIKQDATKWENKINLAGTILTFAASLGLKGLQLVTATNRLKAAQVTGVRLEQMIGEKSIKNAEFVVELIGGAATTGSEIAIASDTAKNTLKGAKGVTSGVLDAKIMHGWEGKSLKVAIAHGVATALAGSMDILKYANPGSLARLLSGLDAEIERQEKSATSMKSQLLDNLSFKILELQKDCELIYGK